MTPGYRTLGPASCLVETSTIVRRSLRDGLREVSCMHVQPEHRGQGHGSALLGMLTLEADEANITMFVSVEPYDKTDGAPDAKALQAWYARHGFVVFQSAPVVLMARVPQRIARAEAPKIMVAH